MELVNSFRINHSIISNKPNAVPRYDVVNGTNDLITVGCIPPIIINININNLLGIDKKQNVSYFTNEGENIFLKQGIISFKLLKSISFVSSKIMNNYKLYYYKL